MLRTSSGEYDGLEKVGLLCMVVDGLAMVSVHCWMILQDWYYTCFGMLGLLR